MVERDLNDGWATKLARCRVRVISQLNALQVNADNALSSFSFSFVKKSNFYRWVWADTSAARASAHRAKLVQHLCGEDEKTSQLCACKVIPGKTSSERHWASCSSLSIISDFFFFFLPNFTLTLFSKTYPSLTFNTLNTRVLNLHRIQVSALEI